jgi:hypothetical protein
MHLASGRQASNHRKKLGGRDDFRRQLLLWEVFPIQSDEEIGPAFFSAGTEAIVTRIRRDLDIFSNGYFFSFFSQQIHQPARYAWANVQPFRHLFVFLQNLRRHEPDKPAALDPLPKGIGTGIIPSQKRTLEGRNPGNQDRCVQYDSTPAPLLARLQR